MAQEYVYGTFARDDLKGVPECVAPGRDELLESNRDLLAIIGMDSLGTPCKQTVYDFYEKQWRPMRTTLNGSVAAGVTTFIFSDQSFKPGEYIKTDSEVIKLGSTSNYLTFTGCTRSVGGGADADHADGASVRSYGKPWTIGSAAGTGDMIVQPNKVTNYTRIIKREIAVSRTAAVIEEYHRTGNSRYDANLMEQRDNALQELENGLIDGVAVAAVADSTAGQAEGIFERIRSGSGTDQNGTTPTRDQIRVPLRGIKDYGGSGSLILCSDYMADVFSDWQLPYLRAEAGSPAAEKFGNTVKLLELSGGTLAVLPMPKIKNELYILSPEFIRCGPLTASDFIHTFHGKDGDRIKGELVAEYTYQVGAPKAHHVLYDVASS